MPEHFTLPQTILLCLLSGHFTLSSSPDALGIIHTQGATEMSI